jgi:hypothetical protein
MDSEANNLPDIAFKLDVSAFCKDSARNDDEEEWWEYIEAP